MMQPRGIVLFVHGFGSSAKCWQPLLKLLRSDAEVTAQYDLVTWEYPTKWVELNVLGRIPRLAELGKGLADEIDSPAYRGRAVTLVGHSQGGLVIQSFLAQAVQRRESWRLRRIRQAILLATPTGGSTTGFNLRMIASTLFRNPQELTLRVLNPDIADMKAVIRNQILEAREDTETSHRVPIHAFCGMQDAVVPEASARGMFDSVRSVPGTHFSILEPPHTSDPRYRELVEILLDPGGHKHRFEVADYRATIAIEPREPQALPTPLAQKPFIEVDNYATVKRTLRFAYANRCDSAFSLRYGTRNGGYVIGHTSHPNRASAAEIGRWQDTGEYYQFDFVPLPGDEYCLAVEVFQGFGEGQRNVHFHLGRAAHFRRMTFELDLSAYILGGHVLTRAPQFYLEPVDRGHSDLCRERKARDPLDIHSESADGRYTWVLEDVEDGVVDIIWNFVPLPAAMPRDTSAEVHSWPEQ
jgi:pimeloyl-ACP methyl ester carboxylesterase